MKKTEGFDFLAAAGEIKGTMQSLQVGTLIGNILWQGSLNQIWSMINSMQTTVHVQLINTRCPSNVQLFNDIIMQIAYFEILPEEGLETFYIWKLLDDRYFDKFKWEETDLQAQNQVNYSEGGSANAIQGDT